MVATMVATPMVWLPLLLLFVVSVTASTLASSLPGCPSDCGGIPIPYPFGIGPNCFLKGFDITCNTSTIPNKPFLNTGNLEVHSIGSETGLLRINQFIAKDCYSDPGSVRTATNASINLADYPYRFSNTRNQFVSIGCDTKGYIIDNDGPFLIGCDSFCTNIDYVQNSTCNGIGCCQTSIPRGIRGFRLQLESFKRHASCLDFSPCSYAFLADLDSFVFNIANFTELKDVDVAPVTLEWFVPRNGTCKDAKDDDQYACVADQSFCYDSDDLPGYRCNCSEGYGGNPYIKGGCIDINECENSPCANYSRCQNDMGNYTCICDSNMDGDGRKTGTGCSCKPGTQWMNSGHCKDMPKFPRVAVAIGSTAAIIFLCANILWSYWALRKKKINKLKEKFFQQNGGSLLAKQMSQTDGSTGTMKIFSSKELVDATHNFADDRVLGKGGFGTVYRGDMPDGRVVAVKKSKISNKEQNEQFINEVLVLSNINHRNVVKLLGLCLETEVPLLIYEFILNGTLSEQIHDESRKGSLSLENRLRIAKEIAEALAYLHSSASIPILHRDVKSSNILLDDNFVAKVSDFGMSRLVAFDENCLNSLVRGTFGYLDPEYFQSGVFTDKSDVYSFGVLLAELLTGQKAVLLNKGPGNGNLAGHFIYHFNEKRLEEIFEDRLRDEGQKEQLLAVCEIAIRCLCMKRDERPTMKEVAKDLEELMFTKHPWTKKSEEEVEPFLMKPLLYDPELFKVSTSFSRGETSDHSALPFNLMR